MKTTTLKLFLATITIAISMQMFAQDLVGSAIKVKGSRYSDKVWVFEVDNTTRGYDWGWDAYKLNTVTTLPPSIYAAEPNDNFQIDVVPTFDNTYLSFRSGEDSIYTLSVTNQLIESRHKHFYIFDSVANTTVDMFVTGSTYTFSVTPRTLYNKRFKLMTALPVVVTTPVDTTTTVTTPSDTTSTRTTLPTTNDEDVAPSTAQTINSSSSITTGNQELSVSKIKVFALKDQVVVMNSSSDNATVALYQIGSGKLVSAAVVSAKSELKLPTNPGACIAKITTNNSTVRVKLICR